jgi:hypothetical protein
LNNQDRRSALLNLNQPSGCTPEMEDFSIFKSKERTKKCVVHHSLFVPHIPLFEKNVKRNSSVSELIALNERHYDANTNTSGLLLSSLSYTTSCSSHIQMRQTVRHSKVAESHYKKYEHPPTQFKRKRIKDIDLRFTNTGIMPYCDYLRGIKSTN